MEIYIQSHQKSAQGQKKTKAPLWEHIVFPFHPAGAGVQWSWETAAPEDSAARASPEVRGGSQQRLQHTGPHLHLQGRYRAE